MPIGDAGVKEAQAIPEMVEAAGPFRGSDELMAEVAKGSLQQMRERMLGKRDSQADLALLAGFWPDGHTKIHESLLASQYPLEQRTPVQQRLILEYFNLGLQSRALSSEVGELLTPEELRVFDQLALRINQLNPALATLETEPKFLNFPKSSLPEGELGADPLLQPEKAKEWLLENNNLPGGLSGPSLAYATLFIKDSDLRRTFLARTLGLDVGEERISRLSENVLPDLEEWLKTVTPYKEEDKDYPARRVANQLKELFLEQMGKEALLRLWIDADLARASQALLLHLVDEQAISSQDWVYFKHSGPRWGEEFADISTIQTPAQLIEQVAEGADFRTQPTISMEFGARPPAATNFGVRFPESDIGSLFPSLQAESSGARLVRSRYVEGDFSLFPSQAMRGYAEVLSSIITKGMGTVTLEWRSQLEQLQESHDLDLLRFLANEWPEEEGRRVRDQYLALIKMEKENQRRRCQRFAQKAELYRRKLGK